MDNVLYVDKHKPKCIDDIVLNDNLKAQFKAAIRNKSLTHVIFSGIQGIGKTTLATIIAKELDAEVLRINCATEGSIAIAQSKLVPFCNAMSFDGRPKVVILDELDSASATQDSSFQKALRNIIEAAQSDTLFIGTCNYEEKIIGPVKSRCPIVHLSFTDKDLLKRIISILDVEKIEYTKETLKDFVKLCMAKYYPDIRSILNYLQMSTSTGKLIVSENLVADSDKVSFIKELLDKVMNSKNIIEARQFYTTNKAKIQDFQMFGSEIYNYVIDNNLVTSLDGVLAMTDILYRLNVVVDKDSQFFGLLVCIKKHMES